MPWAAGRPDRFDRPRAHAEDGRADGPDLDHREQARRHRHDRPRHRRARRARRLHRAVRLQQHLLDRAASLQGPALRQREGLRARGVGGAQRPGALGPSLAAGQELRRARGAGQGQARQDQLLDRGRGLDQPSRHRAPDVDGRHQATHVPYKGGEPSLQALLAGETKMAFVDLSIAGAHAAARPPAPARRQHDQARRADARPADARPKRACPASNR